MTSMEVGKNKRTDSRPVHSVKDNFGRLTDLSFVKLGHSYYKDYKDNRFVGSGIAVLEKSAAVFSGPVVKSLSRLSSYFPEKVSTNWSEKTVAALEYLDTTSVKLVNSAIKVKYQVGVKTQRCVDNFLHKIVGSSVGSLSLQTCDIVIDIMEVIVDKTQSDKSTQCPSRGSKGDVKVQSHAVQVDTVTPHPSIERLAANSGVFGKFVSLVVSPFKFLLKCLQFIRNKLVPYESIKSGGQMSPSKMAILAKRRKLSPRKRLSNRSFLNRFITHTMGFLGVRKMTRFPPHQLKVLAAAKLASADATSYAKRAHSELSDESYSDEDLDYLEEGLENYISEEDPDFEPAEEQSDDSFEFEEGDSESFLDMGDDNAENINPSKVVITSPGKITTRASWKKKSGKSDKTSEKTQGKLAEKKTTDVKVDNSEKKTSQLAEEKLSSIREETENKPKKKDGKVAIGKAERKYENKENEFPVIQKSPTKAVPSLRPQNASSPILKPEWKRVGLHKKTEAAS